MADDRGPDEEAPAVDRPTGDRLATAFEQQRPRLRAIALRMLGGHADAEDAVQEAWLRLQRTDADGDGIDNLGGWLTTVVSRVCLDQLRSRGAHPEDPVTDLPAAEGDDPGDTPEEIAVQADAVGAALVVVLETLNPLERLAFVLHDLFGLPFDDIAPIVERSPAAARQLASRARRRIRGAHPTEQQDRQREVVQAFLAASREGDFGRLLQLLDPEVELRAEPATVHAAQKLLDRGAPRLDTAVQGADAVARVFAGRAGDARTALIDGLPGAAWAPRGKPRTVFAMRISAGRITRIEVIGDRHRIDELDVLLD